MTLPEFQEIIGVIFGADESKMDMAIDVALAVYRVMLSNYKGSLTEDDIELAVRRGFD